MRKASKIAAITAGIVLTGGAAATAVTAPDAAQNGLSTAEQNVGTGELPATKDSHPGADPESASTQSADAADHGAAVSDIARATESGPGKGAVVADVASDGRSGGDAASSHTPVSTPNGGGTPAADEASDGASEAGTSEAADQAGLGSGNAGDHGQP